MQIFTDYDKVNEGVSGVKNSLKSPYWPHESGIFVVSWWNVKAVYANASTEQYELKLAITK